MYTFTRAPICFASFYSCCEILSRSLRNPLKNVMRALAQAAGTLKTNESLSAVHVPTCTLALFHGVEVLSAECSAAHESALSTRLKEIEHVHSMYGRGAAAACACVAQNEQCCNADERQTRVR